MTALGVPPMKLNKFYKILAVVVAGFTMSIMATSLQAATFGVRVVTPQGEPIAGAAVCIGTHGDYKKFGAMFTSADGSVLIDVPPVPLVVTVSKTRFAGLRLSEPARMFNLVKVIELRDGQPGPRCKAGSTLADSGRKSATPSIRDVKIQDNSVSIRLVPHVAGGASHYRLATRKNMENVNWVNFSDEIPVDSKMLGKTVYLQVARISKSGESSIESHSKVYPVSLKNL